MGEYMAADIEIGGEIKDDAMLAALIDAIVHDGGEVGDYGADRATDDNVAFAIGLAVEMGEPLRICDEQASWGHFEATEAACQALGLPYRTRADGNGAYDATLYWWCPGMAAQAACVSTSEGGAYLDIEDVRKALDAGGADGVRALLARNEPPDLPPLSFSEELAARCAVKPATPPTS